MTAINGSNQATVYIPLSGKYSNKTIKVNWNVYDSKLRNKKLYPCTIGNKVYVTLYDSTTKKQVYLHSLIKGPAPKGWHVDHIDGDEFNNHDNNIRHICHSCNLLHRPAPRRSNVTGFKGVALCGDRYIVTITPPGTKKQKRLGSTKDFGRAKQMYLKAVLKYQTDPCPECRCVLHDKKEIEAQIK